MHAIFFGKLSSCWKSGEGRVRVKKINVSGGRLVEGCGDVLIAAVVEVIARDVIGDLLCLPELPCQMLGH